MSREAVRSGPAHIGPSLGRLEYEGTKQLENNEVEMRYRLFSWYVPRRSAAWFDTWRRPQFDGHAPEGIQKHYRQRLRQ